MLPASDHNQERAVDVACLHSPCRRPLLMLPGLRPQSRREQLMLPPLPTTRRELLIWPASCRHPGEKLMLPASDHNQERAVDVACLCPLPGESC